MRLTNGNVEVSQPAIELKAKPLDYPFKNVWNQPIEPANFYDLFRDVQRTHAISPLRDPYSAKDTYISLALTNDVSLTWPSEQNGVAVATLLKTLRKVHSFLASRRSGETPRSRRRKRSKMVQIGHPRPLRKQIR